MLGTDVALLLIMLAGLFRLRKRGGSKFELARLLWKQVRCSFCLPRRPPSTNLIFTSKGIIYLVAATTAELIPVVRLASFPYPLLFNQFLLQVFLSLDLNGNFLTLT